MNELNEEELMSLLSSNIQKFIREQLTLTDNPLILAGCLAAQLHHFYVALLGKEDTSKVFEDMSSFEVEQQTIH